MKNIFRIVLLAALAALGIWLWTVLFPGPEKVIRKHLAEMARKASFSPGRSDLARLVAARGVADYFGTNVEMNVDLGGHTQRNSMSREEITQAVMLASSGTGSFQVKFPDINVTLAPDRQSAVADVTIEVNISGEHDPIVQEMKFTLQKTDGQWLITRVETVRAIS
jgi:hypothetical protein